MNNLKQLLINLENAGIENMVKRFIEKYEYIGMAFVLVFLVDLFLWYITRY